MEGELQHFLHAWQREIAHRDIQQVNVEQPTNDANQELRHRGVAVNEQLHHEEAAIIGQGMLEGRDITEDNDFSNELPIPKRNRSVETTTEPIEKGQDAIFTINVRCGDSEIDLRKSTGSRYFGVVDKSRNRSREKKANDEQIPPSCSFIDKLIEDLDEINTVPFFDIQLPKEIAIVIFHNLSMKDLGRCAQVSRSWKALSEDNVLWCEICHQMGYERHVNVEGQTNWKEHVRGIIEKDRVVLQNWKERKCGLTEFQPRNTGILCTLDMYEKILVAGYSRGGVFLWDLTVDSEPVELKQPLNSQFTSSQPTCSVVRDHVAAVGTADGAVKLFDIYGLSLEHLEAIPGQLPVSHIDARMINGSHHIAASYNDKVLVIYGKDSQWSNKAIQFAEGRKGMIEDIFVVDTASDEDPCCIITQHQYEIFIRTLGGKMATILTSTPQQARGFYVELQDASSGYGKIDLSVKHGQLVYGSGTKDKDSIKLYDYNSALLLQTVQSKIRHDVTAINLRDSPTNMIAVGDSDSRVMLHDTRSAHNPVMTLKGHDSRVTDVQMDEWKVASGSDDGATIVWDQRNASLLWQTNARHPVRKCRFGGEHLVTANVPKDLNPSYFFWENADNRNMTQDLPSVYRGLLRVFDFSVNPLHYSTFLPSICSSGYNEPGASQFNLDLIVPYDDI